MPDITRRNLLFARFTQQLIRQYFLASGNFLDYGAGYGLFVRLMRDSQLVFFAFDEYCTNLFAKQYQVNLKEIESIQFEMITCFEVFEHYVFPVQEIKRLLQYSPNLLFSTELVSNPPGT